VRQTLLIRAPSHLGDLLMALPVLRAIDAQPRLAARLLGPRRLLDWLAPQLPHIVRIGLDAQVRESVEHYRGVQRALLLNGSLRSPLLAWLAGVPERHGLGSRGRRMLLTHSMSVPGPRPFSSVCVELAARMGIEVREREVRLQVREPGLRQADERLAQCGVDGPFVLVLAGARVGSSKGLPAELAAQCLRHEARALVLVSAPGEAQAARELAAVLPQARSLEDVGLEELAALSARAAIVLCSDGGARHVARAAGTAVLTLFGPTDPRHTSDGAHGEREFAGRVPCGPCHRERCPNAPALRHSCWQAIDPERVAAALARPLD
jgi:heptosyltransferase-2